MHNTMDNILNGISKKYHVVFSTEDMCHYKQIKELFYDNKYIEIEDYNDSTLCNIYGLYCEKVTQNYELTKKYYLMAIEHNNNHAMYNLAYYYEKIEKSYDLAKKYYLMAIEHNNDVAMNELALYYENIEKIMILPKNTI